MSDKLAIPCMCGCEVVLVTEFEGWETQPQELWIEFFSHPNPRTWKSKWKFIWAIIKGKEHTLDAIILNKKEAGDLANFINRKLSQHDARKRNSTSS